MEGALARALAGGLLVDPVIMKVLMAIIILLGIERLISLVVSWRKNKKRNGNDDRIKWKEIIEQLTSKISKIGERVEKIESPIMWLREVHSKTDEDGVPVWYVRRSLETSIQKLAENIGKQTEIMDRMWAEMKSFRHGIEKLDDKIRN